MFRKDSFHTNWDLVRVALVLGQFLVVCPVTLADGQRVPVQTDPQTQTQTCIDFDKLKDSGALVYRQADSVFCLWGEEVAGVVCEVRHFVEPGVSPMTRLFRGSVKAGFEVVRKERGVAVSYALFGTDTASSVAVWLRELKEVMRDREAADDMESWVAAARRVVGMPTTNPALYPWDVGVAVNPVRPGHARAAVHRYREVEREHRGGRKTATAAVESLRLIEASAGAIPEDERDKIDRDRNPNKKPEAFSREGLLLSQVFDTERERVRP